MISEDLRQLADSWGLLATFILFLALIGWPFLPRATAAQRRAATMILEDEEATNG